MKARTNILLLEDQFLDQSTFRRVTSKDQTIQLTTVETCEEAIITIDSYPQMYDLVISDYKLQVGNCEPLIQHLRDKHPYIRMLVMTQVVSDVVCAETLCAGAASFFIKASDPIEFRRQVEDVIRYWTQTHWSPKRCAELTPPR